MRSAAAGEQQPGGPASWRPSANQAARWAGRGLRVANGGGAVLPQALAEEGRNVAAEGGSGRRPPLRELGYWQVSCVGTFILFF